MKEKFSTDIAMIAGLGKFVKAHSNGFSRGKFNLDFCEFDQTTKASKLTLPIYVDTMRMMLLAEDVLSGKFKAMTDKAVADNMFQGSPVNQYTSYWVSMGGIKEAEVNSKFAEYQKQFPFLKPGMAISRQMKIQLSNRPNLDWVIRAEYGPGKSSDKGLIVPQGMAPISINVGCSDESLRIFMMALKMHYNAYLNQYYNKFGSKLFPKDLCKVFIPEVKP